MSARQLSQELAAAEAVSRYMRDLSELALQLDAEATGRTAQEIVETVRARRTVFIAGNGGSASTAGHIACDLLGTCQSAGHPRARVIGMADNSAALTALANDYGYDDVFACQLGLQAEAGDLLLLLSVSGESPNLVRAAEAGRRLGMRIVAWTGAAGSALEKHCDAFVSVGSDDYGLAEDLHLALNHIVSRLLNGGAPRRLGGVR
jgi:D-sedoheptulose 7-phosphate isomerase